MNYEENLLHSFKNFIEKYELINLDRKNKSIFIIKKKSIYNQLKNRLEHYKKIKGNDNILDKECPICLEKYKIGEYKRKLHFCNHIFHKKCIDKWFINNIKCPICRTDYY